MPDTETYYNPNTQRVERRKTVSGEDVAKATGVQAGFDSSQKVGTQGNYGPSSTKPKREDYEPGMGGMGKYSKAVREWQRSGSEADRGKEQREALATPKAK